MESADISIPLFDTQQWKVLTSACHCLTHNNGKCGRQHAIVGRTTMENVNHSTQKCKSLSTQSLFLRAPYVDQEQNEPLCGECP